MSSPQPPSAESEQRLLTAIVFTDVAGFSRRMQTAEESTLKLLQRDFLTMRAFCAMHSGRVVKSTGDGLLILFGSAVQAVEWALKTQRHFADQVENLPATEILRHRIGAHLGDVVMRDGDVMGDGVNIAARVQAQAPAGGICISQVVYGVVKNKLQLDVVRLEPRQLKNISEAFQMYHVLLEPPVQRVAAAPAATAAGPAEAPAANWKPWAMAAVALLVVVGGGAALFLAHRDHQSELAGSQQLRETIAASVQQEKPAAAPVAGTPPAASAAAETKAPAAAETNPAPARVLTAAEQFDFARLTLMRGQGARVEDEPRVLAAAQACLPALETWTAATLQRFTADHPLHVVPLRNRGFQASTLFTERQQIFFQEGGARRAHVWAELPPDRRGAIIASMLRSLPGSPPPEIGRSVEAFAFVHRLPELVEMLQRDRGK